MTGCSERDLAMSCDTKCLGTAVTIGELKALIEKYDDATPFGFRNQPLQSLFEVNYSDGSEHETHVVFQ